MCMRRRLRSHRMWLCGISLPVGILVASLLSDIAASEPLVIRPPRSSRLISQRGAPRAGGVPLVRCKSPWRWRLALRVRASRAREIAPWYRRAGSHRAQSPSSSSSWVAYRNVAFHSGCLKWNRVGVAISADAAPICTTGWVEDDRGADACWSLCFRFWICFSPPNICFWLPSSGNSCLPLAELGPRQAAKSDAAPCLHYGGAGVQTPVLSLCLRCGFTERLSPAEAGLFRAALPRPEAGAAGRDRRVVGAAKNRQRQLRYPYSAVGLVTDIAHGNTHKLFSI